MANSIPLIAEPRVLLGRKIKKLRKEGKIPANIYGNGVSSMAVSVTFVDFKRVYKEAGESTIVNLTVGEEKKTRPVLISNVQVDPIKRSILHIDFRQVNPKEKLTTAIPVVITGESPAVSQGGVLVTAKNEIDVEALPTDLPSEFSVDVSTLAEIGQSITVADLKVETDKVKVLADPEEVIVRVDQPQQEEPETSSTETPAEGEASAETSEDSKAEAERGKSE